MSSCTHANKGASLLINKKKDPQGPPEGQDPPTKKCEERYWRLPNPLRHAAEGLLVKHTVRYDRWASHSGEGEETEEPEVVTYDGTKWPIPVYLEFREEWELNGYTDIMGVPIPFLEGHQLQITSNGFPMRDKIDGYDTGDWLHDHTLLEEAKCPLHIQDFSGDVYTLPGLDDAGSACWANTQDLARLLRETYPENSELQEYPFKIIWLSPPNGEEQIDCTHLDLQTWSMLLRGNEPIEEMEFHLVYLDEEEQAALEHQQTRAASALRINYGKSPRQEPDDEYWMESGSASGRHGWPQEDFTQLTPDIPERMSVYHWADFPIHEDVPIELNRMLESKYPALQKVDFDLMMTLPSTEPGGEDTVEVINHIDYALRQRILEATTPLEVQLML